MALVLLGSTDRALSSTMVDSAHHGLRGCVTSADCTANAGFKVLHQVFD